METLHRGMFSASMSDTLKPQEKSGPVHAFEADVSEAFRRARSSIVQITTDLKHLQRRTASAVKTAKRSAKPK